MICQWCNQEAVARCYACGDLVCEAHLGKNDCTRCETAIAAGDRRADRFAAAPLPRNARIGWWRPIPAEDFDAPACYACGGLTRRSCRNCLRRYCPDHGSMDGLCRACEKSSLLGLIFLGFMLVGFMALAIVQGLLSN